MRSNHKCARAVATILAAHAGAAALAAAPADESAPSTGGLAEIVVTAQRRSENIQDVPIAIQALTGETLQQLNVSNFDEFVKYLPNVSTASTGPGQANIYMRGLSVGFQGIQSGGSINGFPNVAVYLDDQSGQLPGRNLDVYAADLERVEVLEGPQGTLFGAGAQAGVIRYITNKPKINVTEASLTRRLRSHRRRRSEHRSDRGHQFATDHRQAGDSRRDLQRPARRLYQQRGVHLHAQGIRSRHSLRELSGRLRCPTSCLARFRRVPPQSAIPTLRPRRSTR